MSSRGAFIIRQGGLITKSFFMEHHDTVPQYRSHPWHGIPIGSEAPSVVNTYIEVVPNDTIKYEIDKSTGYLKVDRPQKFSNYVPALYGFIPKTYCGQHVADYCRQKTDRKEIVGDKDPLDILVLSEHNISHGDIMVPAIPIGGFRMIDEGEADDKIVAILEGDQIYNQWYDIHDIPQSVVTRLKHYFLTYKDMPEEGTGKCEITHTFGYQEARELINLSITDYKDNFQ